MTPDLALQAIGWPLDADGRPAIAAWREAMTAHPDARPARVVEQHRSGYVVADGPDNSFAVESLPEWQRTPSYKKGATPTEQRAGVGDWVLIEPSTEHAAGKDRIVALLPRHSAIKRGAAGEHYKQQLIAANVDTVFVVCGLDADFNPRRIERYLLLVSGSGAEPVVVLTKADEAKDVPGSLAALIELAAQDIAVRAVNARDPDSVAALNPWLKPGSTAVLVGSSGAGKSTLTNTLLGIERMKTGAVRESDARGRHTTTHRALIPLPTGACLIDTPGMRELKPTGEEAVADSFADIEELASQCKFRDCRHAKEPGCAVRAAIEAGKLDPQRFASYHKLGGEVAGAADRLAQRQAENTASKAPGRASPKPAGPAPNARPSGRKTRR
ncbi:MAG: ribosome small subunit-dependent GTPase A [Lysobacter sp.]